jgi:hypothetical protein
MTMTADAAPQRDATALRIALVILAGIETWGALSNLPAIFYDFGHTRPLVIFAQHLGTAKILISPLFAIAALVFALRGQLPRAIIALAALIPAEWISELPSFAIHGLQMSASVPGLISFAQTFIYPLIAGMAIYLARINARLTLATVLVAVPTAVTWGGVIAFAIGVALYGF